MIRSVRFLNPTRKKRTVASAIACGLLLVLPSCKIPDLRQAEPAPGVPAGFNGPDNAPATAPAGTESSAQVPVEEFFRDPVLTHLIQEAVAGNRELKALEEEIQIARYEVLKRRGAYLPFVGYRGSTGLDLSSRFT